MKQKFQLHKTFCNDFLFGLFLHLGNISSRYLKQKEVHNDVIVFLLCRVQKENPAYIKIRRRSFWSMKLHLHDLVKNQASFHQQFLCFDGWKISLARLMKETLFLIQLEPLCLHTIFTLISALKIPALTWKPTALQSLLKKEVESYLPFRTLQTK